MVSTCRREEHMLLIRCLCARVLGAQAAATVADETESKESKEPSMRRRRSQKCGCQAYFKVKKLETETGGISWTIEEMVLKHNHTLNRDIADFQQRAVITEDMKQVVLEIPPSVPPKSVIEILRFRFPNNTSTDASLRTAIYEVRRTKFGGQCLGLMDEMERLYSEIDRLKYDEQWIVETRNEDGILTGIFFMPPAGVHYAKQFGQSVVIHDTTHSLNRHGMPLATFVVISNTGRSILVAAAFIASENMVMLKWIYTLYKQYAQCIPKVIFTEADLAMCNMIHEVFGNGCTHLLCIWHIFQNVQKNFPNQVSLFYKAAY